jgi:Pyridoxamine 5'-phosphate oxidase
VIATRAPDGAPQAALVGIAATDQGVLIFDTAASSRKCRNLRAFPRVAVVNGLGGRAHRPVRGKRRCPDGRRAERCLRIYLRQYPDGQQRADDPEIVLVRIRPDWGRLSDYRPDSFGVQQIAFGE